YLEADHITPWIISQRTCVDDGHLVCVFHHRIARSQGWQPVMINGRVGWRPPAWLDPERIPRFNRLRRHFDPARDLTDLHTDTDPELD
ncbi:MAG: hypothetical protein ACTHMS_01165, partial [Jatrophihabitans sp.]